MNISLLIAFIIISLCVTSIHLTSFINFRLNVFFFCLNDISTIFPLSLWVCACVCRFYLVHICIMKFSLFFDWHLFTFGAIAISSFWVTSNHFKSTWKYSSKRTIFHFHFLWTTFGMNDMPAMLMMMMVIVIICIWNENIKWNQSLNISSIFFFNLSCRAIKIGC